jgi:hypothetical protein
MRIRIVACGLTALVVAVGSLVPVVAGASGAGSGAGNLTVRAGKATAPCTKRALESAMRRAKSHARIARNHAFGCERGFAYAFAIVGSGGGGFEENLLFRASGRRWQVVSRAKYCKKPAVPQRVKKAVCFSS